VLPPVKVNGPRCAQQDDLHGSARDVGALEQDGAVRVDDLGAVQAVDRHDVLLLVDVVVVDHAEAEALVVGDRGVLRAPGERQRPEGQGEGRLVERQADLGGAVARVAHRNRDVLGLVRVEPEDPTTQVGLSQALRVASRVRAVEQVVAEPGRDRKSTRLNSSHVKISYAVFCLKKKKRTASSSHRRTSVLVRLSPLPHHPSVCLLVIMRRPPTSTLFPYTTLFRSTGTVMFWVWYGSNPKTRRPRLASRRPSVSPRASARLNRSSPSQAAVVTGPTTSRRMVGGTLRWVRTRPASIATRGLSHAYSLEPPSGGFVPPTTPTSWVTSSRSASRSRSIFWLIASMAGFSSCSPKSM